MKKLKGIIAPVLAMAMVLLSCLTVTAAPVTGSITVNCSVEQVIISSIEMQIFKIGERQTGDEIKLTGDFADYNVSLDITSASAMQEAATTLENYARVDKISPTDSVKSDEKGIALFENVAQGIYLVTGLPLEVDTLEYTPVASIVEVIDMPDRLDITTNHKFKATDINNGELVNFSVKKLWHNDDPTVRPDEIRVELYRNDTLFETVTLNYDNGWTYFWEGMSNDDWRVKEVSTGENYTVTYNYQEIVFEVINTYNPPEETTTTEETPAPVETTTTAPAPQTTPPSTTDIEHKETEKTTPAPETTSDSGTIDNPPPDSPSTGRVLSTLPFMMGVGILAAGIATRVSKKHKDE